MLWIISFFELLFWIKKSLVIHERNTKKISTMTLSLYLIKYDHEAG